MHNEFCDMNQSTFLVNEHKLLWKDGLTIRDALLMMNYTFPMLVIKLNGNLVKKVDYDTTSIPENADLKVIHLISGG
jgi:thiamine biosynthesis protein ThiS